jgi:putative protein-disulfide isomerase
VVACFVSPDGRVAAVHDFTRAARLGVTSYPTLLLHTATGVFRLGSPAAKASQLTDALDRYLVSQ